MFSDITIALLFGIGFGGWVFAKLQRSTGGNTQNSLIGAAVSGFIAILLVMTVLGLIF